MVIVSQMLADSSFVVIRGGCEAGGLWRATSSFGSAFCSDLRSFGVKECQKHICMMYFPSLNFEEEKEYLAASGDFF